jgi:hypothetical protein
VSEDSVKVVTANRLVELLPPFHDPNLLKFWMALRLSVLRKRVLEDQLVSG